MFCHSSEQLSTAGDGGIQHICKLGPKMYCKLYSITEPSPWEISSTREIHFPAKQKGPYLCVNPERDSGQPVIL